MEVVNGTRLFGSFEWKISGKEIRVPFRQTSSLIPVPDSLCKWEGFVQMVNASPERNITIFFRCVLHSLNAFLFGHMCYPCTIKFAGGTTMSGESSEKYIASSPFPSRLHCSFSRLHCLISRQLGMLMSVPLLKGR